MALMGGEALGPVEICCPRMGLGVLQRGDREGGTFEV